VQNYYSNNDNEHPLICLVHSRLFKNVWLQ
jgi:hypothetical protein